MPDQTKMIYFGVKWPEKCWYAVKQNNQQLFYTQSLRFVLLYLPTLRCGQDMTSQLLSEV